MENSKRGPKTKKAFLLLLVNMMHFLMQVQGCSVQKNSSKDIESRPKILLLRKREKTVSDLLSRYVHAVFI